jgi:hypothetical protein
VDWFRPCVEIARHFSWALFEGLVSNADPIRLRVMNQVERGECPGGRWYLAEGVHRTLAAGVLLDQRLVQWRPFTAVTFEDN